MSHHRRSTDGRGGDDAGVSRYNYTTVPTSTSSRSRERRRRRRSDGSRAGSSLWRGGGEEIDYYDSYYDDSRSIHPAAHFLSTDSGSSAVSSTSVNTSWLVSDDSDGGVQEGSDEKGFFNLFSMRGRERARSKPKQNKKKKQQQKKKVGDLSPTSAPTPRRGKGPAAAAPLGFKASEAVLKR